MSRTDPQTPTVGTVERAAAEDRTPLHGILGCCELLLGGQAGPLDAEARRLVMAIASAARRLETRLPEVPGQPARRPARPGRAR